jgi:ubiquitin-protein ligase
MTDDITNCTYTGNNSVISAYVQNPSIVELLLDNAYYALKCSRCDNIFDPIPTTWKDLGIESPQKIAEILEIKMDITNIMKAIMISTSDEHLISQIGENTYGFIKFALSSISITNMCKSNIITPYDFENEKLTNAVSKIRQYKITYSEDIELKFSSNNTVLRFHGSPYENWWSILRKGIMIGSNNKKICLNGAAYGEGIYLSNVINLSLEYSGLATTNITELKGLAIYEVIDDPKWKKTSNIFVINDESALILRYFMVIENFGSLNTNIYEIINFKLNSGKLMELEKEKTKLAAVTQTNAYSKRLMMEYKMLMKKKPEDLGFTMKLAEEGNMKVWQLFITNVENDPLALQMQKLNIPYIEMEIIFPDTYPIEPPFARIVYPHFQSMSGHVTSGGSICMEALSKSGWVPTTNIESLITQIKLVLSDGCAKIDKRNYAQRYSIHDAKIAFDRAVATHGWG